MIQLRNLILFFLLCILHKCKILNAASTKRELSKECLTQECRNAAAAILESIDPKAAPCDDFYKFACGTFLKNATIPKDVLSLNRYGSLDEKIRKTLRGNIEEPIQPNEPKYIKLSKNFYKACMDNTAIAKNGLQTVLGIIKKLGGWPLLEGDSWNEKNFDWKEKIYGLRKFGYNAFYFMQFDVHSDDVLNRNALYIDQAYSIGIDREFSMKGFNDTIVRAYYNFTVDMAVMYGANRATAEKELRENLDFETEFNKISSSDDGSAKKKYDYMTVKELTTKYPGMPWKEYFNKLLDPITVIGDDEVITVRAPTFFEKFATLMRKFPKRVIANYLFMQVVLESVPYVTEEVMTRNMQYASIRYGPNPPEKRARWKECLDMTSNLLSVSNRALYLRKNFNQKSRKNVEQLAVDIEEHFKSIIKEVDWMDEKTRTNALDKLESMKMAIGSFDEFLDDKNLNEYYKTVEITPNNFLQAYLNMTHFTQDHFFSQLRMPVNESDWTLYTHSATFDTKAVYHTDINTLDIPAGILQDIFFNEDRPQYLNYAGIGSFIIGNTITLAFDNQGRKNDKNGISKDWWTPETNKKFLQKSACIKEQYGKYIVQDGGFKLNDTDTDRKNIADNGGVKVSYLAYQDWMRSHGPEPKLPGLNYSQSQLFWIQSAVTQCAKYTPEYLKNINLNMEFMGGLSSPSEFRVNGVFSNRPEFAKDFNCPVGSTMNPVKKCSVW